MPSSGSEDWTDRFVRDLSRHEREREILPNDDDSVLGQLAAGRGLLRPEDLEACLREVQESRARGQNISLGEILVQRRVLTTATLIELLRDPRRGAGEVPDIPRYELQDRLGEGTTAVVYRAWDRTLKRPVALKVLRESAALSDIARERFRREAQAAGGLSHPNVVLVHDVGEAAGRLYIVLELVEGRPLFDSMRKGVPRESLLRTLVQAARGVAAAHAKGIIHRDLKPANILVAPSGEAKVGDFGLAHLAESTLELTRAGSTLGTPLYMAPEQVEGNVLKITPRTDVYALGAVLYEVLTGQPPHVGQSPAEIYEKVLRQEPVPPRRVAVSVPRDLETVTMKALDKDPDRRYPTAAEFAEDLQHALDGEPIGARPEGQASAAPDRRRHSRGPRHRDGDLPEGQARGRDLGIRAGRGCPRRSGRAFLRAGRIPIVPGRKPRDRSGSGPRRPAAAGRRDS
jgi:serine/threonine-protein kinase